MCFCSYILGWRAAVTAGAKENSQDCDTNIFECDLIYFSLKNIFSLLKVQRITGSRKGLSHARLSQACSLFPHLGTFSSITLCSNSWKMFVQVPLGKRLLTLMWSRQSREWVWFPLLRVHPHSEPLFLPACGTAPVLLLQLYQTPQCRACIQPRHTYCTPSSLNSRFQFVDFGVTLIQISSRKV